jgi:hypothetical protein
MSPQLTSAVQTMNPGRNPSLRITSPAPRDVWLDTLKVDPDALVTQSPAWLDSICSTGLYEDASRLYDNYEGRQWILPMVRRKGRPESLTSQASPPSSWGIGGVIAPGGATVEDVKAVFSDLSTLPFLRTTIRPNPLHGSVWAAAAPAEVVAIPRIAHVLDLDGGFDHVWTKRFNGKTRNKIRKAEKAGLTIERDRSGELLPVFYDLFLQSVSRWAAKQHEPLWMARWRARRRDPFTKFESISKAQGDSCRLWIASYHGQPAAAILVLQGANAHYTRGAMNKDLAGPTLANYLLHRVAIEEACEAGCRYYHMGETGSSGSLAQFKSQFGAEAFAYAEYRLERVPISKLDQGLRRIVKRIIGFRDA